MKVTLAQLNSTIGDIEGNLAKMVDALSRAARESSDLVIFPELFLVGYTPRDLLERPSFIEKTHRAIEELQRVSSEYPGTGIIFGAPLPSGRTTGKGLH
ncbi:MAG: NAD+ synthase, partial [Syntrophobacteraceae bacterium]|nr:NAD+ synthase [Syntrophobacteraceae bacterium]